MRTQSHRPFAVATEAGEDALLFISIRGESRLSGLFWYKLELAAELPVDTVLLLGTNATVRLALNEEKGEEPFMVNGIFSEIELVETRGSLYRYRATLVPQVWTLTLATNCRIFQDQSAVDIAKELCKEIGYTEIDDAVTEPPAKLEYRVQYNESSYNFLSRILSEAGIYFYFRHDNGMHTMVLCDGLISHGEDASGDNVEFCAWGEEPRPKRAVAAWRGRQRMQTGSWEVSDYNFETTSEVHGRSQDFASFSVGEYFGYGEGHQTQAGADARAKLGLQRLRARASVHRGDVEGRPFQPGETFTLSRHPLDSLCVEYLVTRTSLSAVSDEFESTGKDYREKPICCEIEATESSLQFRPPARAKKPRICGPQTAMVVGPTDAEISTDEHARVKVRFPWDRNGADGDAGSCWVRVSQGMAGKRWGMLSIPRAGHEVIVAFLEGDPDRPVITGRLYNGENRAPYPPKKLPTITAFRSSSSPGGKGFNELRIDDKAGEEQIFVRAERDLDVRVMNDRFETVENKHHSLVKVDRFDKVENNRHDTVLNDHIVKVGKDLHVTIEGKRVDKVELDRSTTVVGTDTLSVETDRLEKVVGEASTRADTIILSADTNITLCVGDSFIAIGSDGIKISAAKVVVEGGQSFEAAAPNASVEASAELTLKGGMVKIN